MAEPTCQLLVLLLLPPDSSSQQLGQVMREQPRHGIIAAASDCWSPVAGSAALSVGGRKTSSRECSHCSHPGAGRQRRTGAKPKWSGGSGTVKPWQEDSACLLCGSPPLPGFAKVELLPLPPVVVASSCGGGGWKKY